MCSNDYSDGVPETLLLSVTNGQTVSVAVDAVLNPPAPPIETQLRAMAGYRDADNQGEFFAGVDIQRDLAHHFGSAKADGELINVQQGGGHRGEVLRMTIQTCVVYRPPPSSALWRRHAAKRHKARPMDHLFAIWADN